VFGTSMMYEVFERLIFGVPWLMVLVTIFFKFGSYGVYCRFLGFFYLTGSG